MTDKGIAGTHDASSRDGVCGGAVVMSLVNGFNGFVEIVDGLSMRILDKLFLANYCLARVVEVSMDSLIGVILYIKSKTLYKLDISTNGEKPLAAYLNSVEKGSRQTTTISTNGFCCFFAIISSFFAYCRLISNNGASCGVGLEVGHG